LGGRRDRSGGHAAVAAAQVGHRGADNGGADAVEVGTASDATVLLRVATV
jgi:hypothetical protein